MSFRNTVRFLAGRLALIGFALLFSSLVRGAQPTPESLAAWQAHVQQAKTSLGQCVRGESAFLLINHDGPVEKRVRDGRIIVTHSNAGGMIHVPNGLIHDWTGTVFIPGAHTNDVTAVLQDYQAYAATYRPAVIQSHLVNRDRNQFRYQLKFQANSFGVKAGLLGDFRSIYWTEDARHSYSTTEATHLVELANPGSPGERELSPEEARGYVQRTFTIVRYNEADGGVYMEVQAMSLSRDIPAALRWAVAPLVERFSRQVLTTTLEKFRSRVSSTLVGAQAKGPKTGDCLVSSPGCGNGLP